MNFARTGHRDAVGHVGRPAGCAGHAGLGVNSAGSGQQVRLVRNIATSGDAAGQQFRLIVAALPPATRMHWYRGNQVTRERIRFKVVGKHVAQLRRGRLYPPILKGKYGLPDTSVIPERRPYAIEPPTRLRASLAKFELTVRCANQAIRRRQPGQFFGAPVANDFARATTPGAFQRVQRIQQRPARLLRQSSHRRQPTHQ